MIKSLILTAALLGATAAPAFAASAARDIDAPQRTVHFADLNLTTAAGVATFDARVDAAVRSVCPAAYGSLSERRETQDCRSTARAHVAPVRTAVIAAAKLSKGDQLALLNVR